MVIEGGIPLFGRIIVRVEGVVPVSIHGDVYFDLTVRILPGDEESDEGDGCCDCDENGEEVEGVGERGGRGESGKKGGGDRGEWLIRQPAYQVRLPNHICEGRVPQVGDILEISFIAQQANEVVFLS